MNPHVFATVGTTERQAVVQHARQRVVQHARQVVVQHARHTIVQHADRSFPYVLVVGTAGAIVVLGSIWLTALALA